MRSVEQTKHILDEKYLYSTCQRPTRLQRFFNVMTQDYEERDVPCGQCLHCRMTKINEWTTRMRCQSATYNHTYFITLTISSDAPDEVLRAHNYTMSNINVNKKWQPTPITLDKRTLQLFFKRLRRYNNIPTLSYYAVGEYGHKYGRPHYHAILWCDEEITAKMIEAAWQLEGIPFGQIDFNDLNENGTLSSSKANYAFKYVCKYLQKQDFSFEKLPTYKFHLVTDYYLNNQLITLYNEKINEYVPCFAHYYPKDYSDEYSDYGKFVLEESRSDLFGLPHVLSPVYSKSYKPFMLCSKSRSIGGRYFEKFSDKFQAGNFKLFGLLDKNQVFPTYFIRKAKEIICPYFPLSYTEDYSVKVASSACHVPSLESFIHDFQNTIVTAENVYADCEMSFKDTIKNIFVRTSTNNVKRVSDLSFYDKQVHCYYVYNLNHFDKVAYNRTTKDYECFGSVSIESVLSRLDEKFRELIKFVTPFDLSRKINADQLDAYIKSKYKTRQNYDEERERLYRMMTAQHRDRQIKYNNTKTKF